MTAHLARLLTRLYPRAWRDRYADEFEALLLGIPGNFRTLANTLWSAFAEHIRSTGGFTMESDTGSVSAMLKQPSAFLPLGMSFTGLVMVLGYVARYGAVHPTDEGAVGHVWQLLMAGQLPIIAYFAIKWLPRAPRATVYVLAHQAGAACASVATVYFCHLG